MMKSKKILILLLLSTLHSCSQIGCVSGDCYNGYGTYTWASGGKYVGEFKDNRRNGQGTYTFADGGKYVGEWKGGEKSGQG